MTSNDPATSTRIEVRVLFFGAAKDAVGESEISLDLEPNSTAATARELLLERYANLRRFGRSLLFAVNQEYAQPEVIIKAGDELAVLPPVSGG